VACPTTTVGREGGEISLDDPTLSSRHFMIEERGHEFFLRDLGSTNGTFLNGHLVRSSPLKSGDEIKAGKSVFVFSVLEVIPCD
jgi:pSer/pThr/pTyr-binding forkhead associated (FHA) protein